MPSLSKETLDFALIANNVVQFHVQVSNDKQGIEQFIKQAKKQNKTFAFANSLFCVEYKGIYRSGSWAFITTNLSTNSRSIYS